jgi:hypothetical protein
LHAYTTPTSGLSVGGAPVTHINFGSL